MFECGTAGLITVFDAAQSDSVASLAVRLGLYRPLWRVYRRGWSPGDAFSLDVP